MKTFDCMFPDLDEGHISSAQIQDQENDNAVNKKYSERVHWKLLEFLGTKIQI